MPLDRRAASVFTAAFLNQIEVSYKRFLGNQLRRIINEHIETTRSQLPGYYHAGLVYYVSDAGTPIIANLQYLPFNKMPETLPVLLRSRHAEWEEQMRNHERTFPRIKQGVSNVVSRAKDDQDLRDMFPEHALRGLSELSDKLPMLQLERKRPDLYAGIEPPPGEDPTQYLQALQDREMHWDRKLIDMYRPVGELVDQCLSYKFIA